MLKEIELRRACRSFDSSKSVKEEDLNKIIQAGLLAPSAMNKQESVIIAITNKEIRDKLSIINKGAWDIPDPFYGGPVVLLVINKKSPFADVDGACVIENMMIEATKLGINSIWIHRANEELQKEETRTLLSSTGLNFDEYQGVGHVVLGYCTDGWKPVEKTIKENRVIFVK